MKKYLIFFFFLVFLISIIWFFQPFFSLDKIKNISIKIIDQQERIISLPAPLKQLEDEIPEAFLTKQGIINSTNDQREKHGLTKLSENETLNNMAKNKVNDMFKYQYFAHQSPNGQEVADLAEVFNYQFMAIGENLAMGNFLNDQELVQAWMDSPGHRENILSETYQEIGVAALKGSFNGKTVWLAVQHFGLAANVCPEPDKSIKSEIDQQKQEIKQLEETLSLLSAEIKKIRPKWGTDYREKVDQYNNLVDQYNNLLIENKKLVEQYNKLIEEFNQCVSSF
jgi:uncharacterized protein YukE